MGKVPSDYLGSVRRADANFHGGFDVPFQPLDKDYLWIAKDVVLRHYGTIDVSKPSDPSLYEAPGQLRPLTSSPPCSECTLDSIDIGD